MKVLDKSDLENSIHQLTTAINLLKEQIHQVQLDINHLVSLEDALKGKGGHAIRLFYQECHLPLLVFMGDWINDYESTLNKMSQSLQTLEPSPTGFIQQSFLENELIQGLRRADTNTRELTSEANSIIQSVQDIVSLPFLEEELFVRDTRHAQDISFKTIDKLQEFDQRGTDSLEPLQQNLQKMNQYIEQMTSMFRNGEITLSQYKPEILTWQDTYNKLSNNTDITTEQSMLHDITKGIIEGSTNAVADVWEGLKSTFGMIGSIPMITNPGHLQNVIRLSNGENLLEHYRFINQIIQDPKASVQPLIDMPKYIWSGIKDAWNRDVVNGDAESRSAFFSYGLTTLGIGLLGDKGISKAGNIVKTVDTAVKGIKKAPSIINTPTPAMAGGLSQPLIPYNVIHSPLTQIKMLTKDVFEAKGTRKTTEPYDVVPYRPSNSPLENHHGVMDVWAKHNVPNYVSRGANTPTLALTQEQHNATKAVYRQWLFDKTGKKVGGKVDWKSVSPIEIQELTEKMFDAANVPRSARQEYYKAFNQYNFRE